MMICIDVLAIKGKLVIDMCWSYRNNGVHQAPKS